jgi:hypothetical protein
MLSFRILALRLAILAFNITYVSAFDWGSVGSDIETGIGNAVNSVEGVGGQLLGDLGSAFDDFTSDIKDELAKALVGGNGVLAEFTLGHEM